jgi:hypothetical protein
MKKKKGHSTIPDFSRKRPASQAPPDQKQKGVAPPPPTIRSVKPQGTSAKSGQRGR